jgi:aspartate kinase
VLSAIAGTTPKLEEISDYLYKKNQEGANETINELEQEYIQKIDAFFDTAESKTDATVFVKEIIEYIRSFTNDLFTLFEQKVVLAQGEILSAGLFVLMLKERGIRVCGLSALDFMRVDKKDEPVFSFLQENLDRLLNENSQSDVYVTQGYICRNAYGEIDNFNFGGSDYTASLISAASKADELQIWTDVDVMYGNNAGLISNATTVRNINFDEAAELAYFGTKILHPICILPAKVANVPVRLVNILAPDMQGTLISNQTEKAKIKAIASKDGITTITIKSGRMLLAHGFLRKVCEVFEKHQTSIDMLTTSEVGVSATIDNPRFLNEITDDLKRLGIVTVEQDMTIVSIVGDLGSALNNSVSKILDAVKDTPFRMLSYGGSSCSISFIIKKEDKEETLRVLNHNIFKS